MRWPSAERWSGLCKASGAVRDPQPWYERLSAAYSEAHRHYHNQQHIAECLAEFDAARELARRPEAVELAIWFHDAVYDPRAADNEERSATLAGSCLSELGLQTALGEVVHRLVLATKLHDGNDEESALMIDIDLSILGQGEERFLAYERGIRQEYAWVPKLVFALKRAQVLNGFLGRKSIYNTEVFRNRFEEAARRNLKASIKRLKRFRDA